MQELGTKKSEPATTASGVDWYNLLVLLLSTVAVSGIVTLYVLCLAWLNLKSTDADPLERAANLAISDLIRINVVDRNFGTVGIVDFTNNDNNFSPGVEGASREVRSYNTVASLLRTALYVARRYDLQPMGEQAAADLKSLGEMEEDLHRKLLASVKSDGSGKIFERIKRTLSNSNRGGEHLESLKVHLGTIRGRFAVSAIEAEPDDSPAVSQSGRLKTLTPLPVPFTPAKLTLHQSSKERLVLNAADFVEDASAASGHYGNSPLPTVLLIEAQFATRNEKDAKRGMVLRNRQICLIASGPNKNLSASTQAVEGSLALSFPQGKPTAFTSLESILTFKDWQGRGAWQEAVQGAVPGLGQLAPPTAPRLKEMNGTDSLSIALYHWIRQLAHPIGPARLAAVIKTPFPHPIKTREANKAETAVGETEGAGDNYGDTGQDDAAAALQINSGLLKDSDARVYALLYQNKPNEAGQRALNRCFQALPGKFPASALPIIVDSAGRANLPGRQGFDQKLASDLLNNIYATNLAAQDSLAAAKLIQSSSLRAYRNSKERLFLAQTDLDSLTKRLRSIDEDGDDEDDKKEKKSINNEIDWRKNRIAYELNEQKRQLKAISLSQVAIVNATAAATQSFECGSKLFQLCRAGIYRLDNFNATAGGAFLLGKRYIFRPLTNSLQENDIFAEEASPWLAKKMTLFGTVKQMTDKPATQIMVEGRSLSDLLAESIGPVKADPAVIVYTPKTLSNSSREGPLYFREYPFKGLPVPESQLIYYCQNAYFSGDRIGWSILARDLVANHELNAAHQRLGQPLQPAATGWCKHSLAVEENSQLNTIIQAANVPYADGANNPQLVSGKNVVELNSEDETCPGLAAEWQLRSPVLFSDESGPLKSTTLSDPESGQRVQQIPPVGPDVM